MIILTELDITEFFIYKELYEGRSDYIIVLYTLWLGFEQFPSY